MKDNFTIYLPDYYKNNGNNSYLDLNLLDKVFAPIHDTIEHLSGPDASFNQCLMMFPDKHGRTFLMMMAIEKDPEYIKPLIKYADYQDVNLRDEDGKTALFYACKGSAAPGRQKEVIRLLLEAEANPRIKTNEGLSPLMVMSLEAGYDNFERMVLKYADVNAEANWGDGGCAYSNTLGNLIRALKYETDYKGRLISDGSENKELVKKIYELYKKFGLKSDLGRGKWSCVAMLKISLEADLVEAAKNVPRVPESEIIERDFRRLADKILPFREDPVFEVLEKNLKHPLLYSQDRDGYTLLMKFMLFGTPQKFVDLLLVAAPEGYVNKQNKSGENALLVFLEKSRGINFDMDSYKARIIFLLDEGVNPTVSDKYGRTVLSKLLQYARLDIYWDIIVAMQKFISDEQLNQIYMESIKSFTSLVKYLKKDSVEYTEHISHAKDIYQLYLANTLDTELIKNKQQLKEFLKLIGDECALSSLENQIALSEMHEKKENILLHGEANPILDEEG